MCGINGFTWEDKRLIRDMCRTISHRGPDQNGIYTDRLISLGHQRLSIIDLSEKGRQPIYNEDGSIFVVFNGEIYNYKELKRNLITKGHRFFSNTDTEVIVHAYEEYGDRCVQHFNGAFAFAVWDSNKKQLFLARDRLGIKPLYYTITDNNLIFSSEIKAILQHKNIKREVNRKALHDYLTFRCVSIHETMFKGINKLSPGCTLKYDLKKRDYSISRYWQLIPTAPTDMNEHSLIKKTKEMLKESVKKRLMSDVPLGVYVSGGVDSGTMVAMMSQLTDKPIETFTVGFGLEEHKDELEKAREITNHFNTNHHEIIVKPETVKVLPKIIWHADEPMCDPTSIPTYYLSEETKRNCTVVLTGEGADETFAGYSQYKMMNLHDKYVRFMPQSIRSALIKTAEKTPPFMLNKVFKYAEGLGKEGMRRFSEFMKSDDQTQQYLNIISIYSEKEKKDLLSEKSKKIIGNMKLRGRLYGNFFSLNTSQLNKLLLLDTNTLLAENLLMKVDKNTMAHAVEARVPFLDHNMVEFAQTIPSNLKLNKNTEKYILRKAVQDILPKSVVTRKKDRFFVPINHWFDGELMEFTKQVLSKDTIQKQGYFNHDYVDKIWNNYKDSKIFYARQLWSLLTFQLWHKIFIDRENIDFNSYELSKIN